MFTCRLHLEDEILVGNGRSFRVLDVVPFEQEESQFVGLLQEPRRSRAGP